MEIHHQWHPIRIPGESTNKSINDWAVQRAPRRLGHRDPECWRATHLVSQTWRRPVMGFQGPMKPVIPGDHVTAPLPWSSLCLFFFFFNVYIDVYTTFKISHFLYLCLYLYLYLYMYIFLSIYIHAYAYIYIYTHIHHKPSHMKFACRYCFFFPTYPSDGACLWEIGRSQSGGR